MPRSLTETEIEQFRADLCRVAERLFAEHGYSGVTLRAMARELGCSPMTPYRYFENKDAIFTAVRTEAFIRFGQIFEKLSGEHRDPIERFYAYSRAYVNFARREPHAYRIMFEIARETTLHEQIVGDPERRSDVLRGWQLLVQLMEELVETRRAQGDPLDLAHLAWVMLHGLVTLELSNKFLLGRTLDDLIESAIETFLRGIGAPPTFHVLGAIDGPPDRTKHD